MSVIHFRHQPGAKYGHHGSPTLRNFVQGLGQNGDTHPDERRALIDICQGPVESGKTLGSISKVYEGMCTIPRCKDGIRRSKWLIYRPTYPELLETVIPDFLEWFPEAVYGVFKGSGEPMRYEMRFADVEAEVIFMALDPKTETYKKKLRSLQVTGAYGNEIQFQSLSVFNAVTQRTGRYPNRKMCPDYDRKKRHWADLNAPEHHNHWVLYMRGDTPIPSDMSSDLAMAYEIPEGWEFYVQPPAVIETLDEKGDLAGYRLNTEAENLQNMGNDPYIPGLGGLTRDEIDRDYRNITRARKTGANRYPGFQRDRHVAKRTLRADPNYPILLGCDGGASPAVTFWQKIGNRWFGLDALIERNLTTPEFVPMIVERLHERFAFAMAADGPGVIAWGDPALGWQGEQGKPSQGVYKAKGIDLQIQWKKDRPHTRWMTGRRMFSEFPNGEPKILLCPTHCQKLAAAFENCTMKQTHSRDTEEIKQEVRKNAWSHPVESAEYIWCGAGEAHETVRNPSRPQRTGPINTLKGPHGGLRKRSWSGLQGARR